MFSKQYKKKPLDTGFSLIELLITSAIITIVTAIVVVKHSAFDNVVLLKNQTYELALAIREAQVYAVSSRGEGSNFRERYGVYFSVDTVTNRQKVIIYINESSDDSNREYVSGVDSIIETVTLDSRFEINDVCADTMSDGEICIKGNTDEMSVSFKRPDFDPYFTLHANPYSGDEVTAVRILIAPTNNVFATRTIEITQTGQISVN